MRNFPEPVRRLCAAASIVIAGFLLFGLLTRIVSRELAELKTGARPALQAAATPAPAERDPTLSPTGGIAESFKSAFGLLARLGPAEQSEFGFWAALGSRRDAARGRAGALLGGVAEWMRGITAREVEP